MMLGVGVITVVVLVLSCALTWILSRPGSGRLLLDHPTHRSLHEEPTPRGGGIAITCGILTGGLAVALLVPFPEHAIWIGVAVAAIVTISFLDDLSHVHKGVRITVHFLVAGVMVYGGLGLENLDLPGIRWHLPSAAVVVLSSLYVVWVVNVYNFMDGMDGFAAGMAVFGFGTFALLGALAGEPAFAATSMVVAAGAGGFLVFNFPPARIFMGDAGSSLLGVLAAGFSLWASAEKMFPLWVSVLIFSPFIVDATFTLFRRLLRRERVWESHKSHCYQRLVELGWGHRKTVLWEYTLMMLCSVSAVAAMLLTPDYQRWLLSFWAVTYAMLIAVVYWLEARQRLQERLESF